MIERATEFMSAMVTVLGVHSIEAFAALLICIDYAAKWFCGSVHMTHLDERAKEAFQRMRHHDEAIEAALDESVDDADELEAE